MSLIPDSPPRVIPGSPSSPLNPHHSQTCPLTSLPMWMMAHLCNSLLPPLVGEGSAELAGAAAALAYCLPGVL